MAKPIIAVYDTKPYDRDYLTRTIGVEGMDWHFHDFQLERETAFAAAGAQALCVFVNGIVDRQVLERLGPSGVRMVDVRGSRMWIWRPPSNSKSL